MKYEELKTLAIRLQEIATSEGCRAVIVAVSDDERTEHGTRTGHSLYFASMMGPCLDLDGLARRVSLAADKNWTEEVYARHGEKVRFTVPFPSTGMGASFVPRQATGSAGASTISCGDMSLGAGGGGSLANSEQLGGGGGAGSHSGDGGASGSNGSP